MRLLEFSIMVVVENLLFFIFEPRRHVAQYIEDTDI